MKKANKRTVEQIKSLIEQAKSSMDILPEEMHIYVKKLLRELYAELKEHSKETFTMSAKYIRSTHARHNGKGSLGSYTTQPYQISKVSTSEGDKWIPCAFHMDLCSLLHNKPQGVTFTRFNSWEALTDGIYLLIGARECERVYLTVKNGRFSYHSKNERGEARSVQDKSLAQVQRKKIVWIVTFECKDALSFMVR